jgi:hypothetical protein
VNFAVFISTATDSFQSLFIVRKNQGITFKVTFFANEQLSALITPGLAATNNFQRLFIPIQRTN